MNLYNEKQNIGIVIMFRLLRGCSGYMYKLKASTPRTEKKMQYASMCSMVCEINLVIYK